MNATQKGHRAAAQGCPRESVSADAHAAYDAVIAHRGNGLDPGGHQPPPPHLCARNGVMVCNCCSRCTTDCWSEKLSEKAAALPTVRGLMRKVFKKILW